MNMTLFMMISPPSKDSCPLLSWPNESRQACFHKTFPKTQKPPSSKSNPEVSSLTVPPRIGRKLRKNVVVIGGRVKNKKYRVATTTGWHLDIGQQLMTYIHTKVITPNSSRIENQRHGHQFFLENAHRISFLQNIRFEEARHFCNFVSS
jgi:hypothetical protein